jgi:hypothetical protein
MFVGQYSTFQRSCIVLHEALASSTHLRVSRVAKLLFARALCQDVVQRCWKDKNRGIGATTEVQNGRYKIQRLVVVSTSL